MTILHIIIKLVFAKMILRKLKRKNRDQLAVPEGG